MSLAADIEALFDEQAFVEQHRDVALAVEAGIVKSGLAHLLRRGHQGFHERNFLTPMTT